MDPLPSDLRERNRRWAELRALSEAGAAPGDPAFESALARLQALIRWPRGRILAGLGLTGPEESGTQPD